MGPTTTGGRVNAIAVLLIGSFLLLLSAIPAQAAGDDARITADITCDAVEATSSKDISNVVVQYADGSRERFEGLSGRTWSHELDQAIDGVWVKSGNNASGDGPGYGQWFPSDTDCEAASEGTVTEQQGPEEDTPETPEGSNGDEQGSTAEIVATVACHEVVVRSTKDISNVVIRFADGSIEKVDGLTGRAWSRTFDREVDGVWVKSGNNKSGDGPGYGEWFPGDATCGGQAPVQDTAPEREAASEDVQPEAPVSAEVPAPAGGVLADVEEQGPAADQPDVAVDTPSTANTAVLGVAIERPVTAAGSETSVAGTQAQAGPSGLPQTGAPAGWLLSIAVALSVYGLVALDLTGRRTAE